MLDDIVDVKPRCTNEGMPFYEVMLNNGLRYLISAEEQENIYYLAVKKWLKKNNKYHS